MGFSALILFQYRKGGTPTLLKVCIEKSTFFSVALFLPNSMLRSGASTGEINIIVYSFLFTERFIVNSTTKAVKCLFSYTPVGKTVQLVKRNLYSFSNLLPFRPFNYKLKYTLHYSTMAILNST